MRIFRCWRALGMLMLLVGAAGLAAAAQPADKDPKRPVATVNGEVITIAEVSAAVNRALPLQNFHGSVDPGKLRKLSREILQKEIDRRLETADAARLGVEVSAEDLQHAVDEVVARFPSIDAFKARLDKGGFTMSDVEDAVRKRKLFEKAEEHVADSDREISEAEARTYYDANLAKFREPRRAVVRQILNGVEPLGRTDEVWKKAEDEILELRRRALAGEDFAALAREYSDAKEGEKQRGGLLGAVHEGRLPADIDKVVWTLQAGEMSAPVRSLRGVYLIKVDRLLPERLVPFDEVQSKLRQELQAKAAAERLDAWRRELRSRAKIEYVDPYFAPEE